MRGIDLDPTFRRAAAHEGCAAQIGYLIDARAACEPVGDLTDLPLAVAVHEQVRFRIEQNRATDLLRPIVEMCNAAQRGFDAPDDDRDILERLAHALRINDDGPVGTLATLTARRVGVIAADATLRGIAIDHRIHVSGGDAEKQVWPAESGERLRAVPVRLRDHPDPEAMSFQDAPDDGHAEARVVDVRIAGDQDDIAAIPPQGLHFFPRHGQEWSGTEARGPVFAVTRYVACGLHWGGAD